MKRTNIYLEERQLGALRAAGEARGESVAAVIRRAVDEWLEANGVRAIPADEWQARFESLLERRARVAGRRKPAPDAVERDVAAAVAEVRSARRR
jgi:hypothetical protein